MKMWSGRFTKSTDELTDLFTSSLAVDYRLYPYDIEASIAHVEMLAEQKIITKKEASQIISGLKAIHKDLDSDKIKFIKSDEDIHMAIERVLIEKIGSVGGKMHTARSRNDQVLTDMKLYIKDKISEIIYLINELQKVIIKMAEGNSEVILPGYTHLQKAQPILFGHYLMAYFFMIERDKQRFKSALKTTDYLPLGSGALAGTTFNINRKSVAKKLGFANISDNSIDGVSSRDFLLEFLSAVNILGLNFSRLAEDLIIYSSEEFNYIEIDDAFATGSSIMPQKKNADVAELIRGKSGQLLSNLVNLSTTVKGLPLSYNRDLQEDKQCTFAAADTIRMILMITIKMLPKINLNKENMLKAAEDSFINATDLADYLAEKGIPFREAHKIVGNIVKDAINKGIYLNDLKVEDFKKYSKDIDEDIFVYLDVKTSVKRHDSEGATSLKQLKKQIKKGKILTEKV